MKGSVVKRCACSPQYDSGGRRRACKLTHASWSFVDVERGVGGARRQIKRGGFATKRDAESALAELIDQASKGSNAHDSRQTVGASVRLQHLRHGQASLMRRGGGASDGRLQAARTLIRFVDFG